MERAPALREGPAEPVPRFVHEPAPPAAGRLKDAPAPKVGDRE